MRANRLATIILSLILVIALAGCASAPLPTPARTPTPTATPTPWSPDRNKLLAVPREYLAREGGYTIDVPPADYLIIPISVGQYEHLASLGWSAKGKQEDYIDYWMVNSQGDKVSQSGRSFNYGTVFAFGNSPGLGPGTYYIYLSNEFTSASAKQVTLSVKWSP